MARRRVARDRNGRPIRPKGRKQQEPEDGKRRRRRRGFAGQDTINVNCPPGQAATTTETKKSKFPWGTIFVTGLVTGLGSIVAYRAWEHFSGKSAGATGSGGAREGNPSEGRQAVLNARDMLLLTSPGALENMPHHPLMQNPGPSHREVQLLEREASLREKVAELEGFIKAQQAAAQAQQAQRSDMQMLLDAMEDEE